MLAELSEQNATGEIARIYAELRELCAVPYVSSLQRHLATRTGWLEWAWAIVRPAFVDGSAQTQAWQLAATLNIHPLPSLSRSALRLLGVDSSGEQAIRDVCNSFIRVSPTNLMLSGLLRQVLKGGLPRGSNRPNDEWTPPPSLPALPPLVYPDDLTVDQHTVLFQFGTEVDGEPFVPGLYRSWLTGRPTWRISPRYWSLVLMTKRQRRVADRYYNVSMRPFLIYLPAFRRKTIYLLLHLMMNTVLYLKCSNVTEKPVRKWSCWGRSSAMHFRPIRSRDPISFIRILSTTRQCGLNVMNDWAAIAHFVGVTRHFDPLYSRALDHFPGALETDGIEG